MEIKNNSVIKKFILKIQLNNKILNCYQIPINFEFLSVMFKERFKLANWNTYSILYEDLNKDYISIENNIDYEYFLKLIDNDDSKYNKKLILLNNQDTSTNDSNNGEFINKNLLYNYLTFINKLIKSSQQDYNQLIKKKNKPCQFCFTRRKKSNCKHCFNKKYIPLNNNDCIILSMIENKIRQLILYPLENLIKSNESKNLNKIYEFNKIKKIEVRKSKIDNTNTNELELNNYSQISYTESENENIGKSSKNKNLKNDKEKTKTNNYFKPNTRERIILTNSNNDIELISENNSGSGYINNSDSNYGWNEDKDYESYEDEENLSKSNNDSNSNQEQDDNISFKSNDINNIKNMNETLKKMSNIFFKLSKNQKNDCLKNNSNIRKLKNSPLELIKEVKNEKNKIRKFFN